MTLSPNQASEAQKILHRGRGPTKPFPLIPFEEALALPKGIMEHGVQGEINRLTLLGKLNMSPTSSKTRSLITNAGKYGLTSGGQSATTLRVTEGALILLDSDATREARKRKEFDLAISLFDPFLTVYDKLKEDRLKDETVLKDEFERSGVPGKDSGKAARIFVANLRHVGLIQEIAGSEQVRSIDEVVSGLQPPVSNETAERDERETAPTPTPIPTPTPTPTPTPAPANLAQQSEERFEASEHSPPLHIDIQIHIDSTASAEQIDLIFASMARHLYRREG